MDTIQHDTHLQGATSLDSDVATFREDLRRAADVVERLHDTDSTAPQATRDLQDVANRHRLRHPNAAVRLPCTDIVRTSRRRLL
jgi:uncharacterized protein HemX